MTRVLDEVMREYRERFPDADKARVHDQYAYVAWHLLREMLTSVDWTLAHEEVDERVHYRVLMTMALGGPSPYEADLRAEQEAAFLQLIKYGPPPTVHIVTQDEYDRIAAEAERSDG